MNREQRREHAHEIADKMRQRDVPASEAIEHLRGLARGKVAAGYLGEGAYLEAIADKIDFLDKAVRLATERVALNAVSGTFRSDPASAALADAVGRHLDKGCDAPDLREALSRWVDTPPPSANHSEKAVLVPRAFLSWLQDVHQDAADALVDEHGDKHREIVDELRHLLTNPRPGVGNGK